VTVPIWAGPVTISNVRLLEAQTDSWAHRGVLLACVVLVDLASYIHSALGASGDNWMNPHAEKMMTSLVGLLRLQSRRNSCLMG
jgi:small neutral amino acid transporter SnatA (MarC family)